MVATAILCLAAAVGSSSVALAADGKGSPSSSKDAKGSSSSATALAATNYYDGQSPVTTGCQNGAFQVTSWNIVNGVYNEVQGRAQLMYSPNCQTNWVNVYGYVNGNEYVVNLSRAGFSVSKWLYNAGTDYTNMVYAPGSTCVTVSWGIQDNATGRSETAQPFSGTAC